MPVVKRDFIKASNSEGRKVIWFCNNLDTNKLRPEQNPAQDEKDYNVCITALENI